MANRFDFGESSAHTAWLDQVTEDVLEPQRPIVDAHHHLWVRHGAPYLLREYAADLASGHNVVATVFAECHSMYRRSGPEALAPVGESEFVAGVAAMSEAGAFGASGVCRAMVGAVDLRLGEAVEAVLDAHEAASGARFRGVRASAAWHADANIHNANDDPEFLRAPEVRAAIGVLQRRGLSLDCWVYHTQLAEVVQLAEDFPQLNIVLNHVGVPVLGGPYRGREEVARQEWRDGMQAVARCANVSLKLGAPADSA